MKLEADRINAYDAAPGGMKAMLSVESYINASGLETSLVELVKMRASQINGCAFCLAMHSKDARKYGESEERLHLLAAWKEASLYSARERAALGWTEALTSISKTHAPDDVYSELAEHFSNAEMANLTLLICQINSWNRFAVGFRYRHN